MSFEVPPHNSIEEYHDLETLADIRRERLTTELDKNFYGTIRDDPSFELTDIAAKYAGILTTVLTMQFAQEERPAQQAAIRDSLKLGSLLAKRILRPRLFAMDYASVLSYGDDVDGFRQFLYESPRQYLTDRPTLTMLVNRYAPAFGSDSMSIQQAKQVTGLTLMQIEQARFATFLDYKLRRFDEEFDAWHATIGQDGEA